MADYSSYTFTIGQIPSGASGYIGMLNALVSDLQTDVTALETTVITQGDTLTANLNAGGFKLTNLGASSSANDACTVSYANSLLTLGGDPGSVAITDLSNGLGTSKQFLVVNEAGDGIAAVDGAYLLPSIHPSSAGKTLVTKNMPLRVLPGAYNNIGFCLSFANGVFFSTGGTSTTIHTSADGETWIARTVPGGNYSTVVWTGTHWVACSSSNTQAIRSTDLVTWTSTTMTQIVYGAGAASDGAGLVIACNASTAANGQRSTDHGATWASMTTPDKAYMQGYIDGLFFASHYTNSTNYYTSPDGITWTTRTLPDGKTGSYSAIKITDGILFQIMSDGTIYKTSDGINWTAQGATPYNNGYGSVFEYSGVLVYFGNTSFTGVFFSHDSGSTWNRLNDTSIEISPSHYTVGGQFKIAENADQSKIVIATNQSTNYYKTIFEPLTNNLFEA